MNYAECLDYLYGQLPMYQRIGKAAYKADLSATHALMEVLEHPYHNFKSVHIAGTNGKGSTSHLLASVFQEAGYKTGLYTSPHLVDFRERIRCNGEMIPEAEVIRFVEEHRASFEQLGLSFFEWTVGLAFHFFSKQGVDIAIVEVGMGGRLDSTNVITPELSIITNIGMDHQQFLGDTLGKIAAEKAGIIKKNVPVIIGRTQAETTPVFEKIAAKKSTSLLFADQATPLPKPPSPLKGSYQHENMQTALQAIARLRAAEWNVSEQAVFNGFQNVLKNTGLQGRWQQLQDSPKVICDVGHNPDGIQHIVDQLRSEHYSKLHLVLGFVSDKNVDAVLRMFPEEATFYLCQAAIPRALPVEQLADIAKAQGRNFDSFADVPAAYHAALHAAEKDDLIFVGGSTFIVADLLSMVEKRLAH